MSLKTPEFFKRPDQILAVLRSLFVTTPLDYIFGLIGACSVASIMQLSFDVDFGPITQALLEQYRRLVTLILDPLSAAIVFVIELIVPALNLELHLSPVWKEGVVLLGIYYQKHARNEFGAGRWLTAAYQFVVGIAIALGFGVGFNALHLADGSATAMAFIASFALAVVMYDAAFIAWSTALLRRKFAEMSKRPVEPGLGYFWTRFRDALVRVGVISLGAVLAYGAASTAVSWDVSGQAITTIMLFIGLAWMSRGLRMANEEPGDTAETIRRYKGFPAGQLGSAVVFPILLGYLLALLGVGENWIGATIELALSIFGW